MAEKAGVSLFNVLVILLLFLCLITDVKSAQLTVSPSNNIIVGAPTLTVRCQATTNTFTSVYQLDIMRTREGLSTEQILGNVKVGKNPELGPGLTNPKYSVSASLSSIDAVSASYLQIVIQDPGCNDKGEYICSVTGGNSAGGLTREKRTNVTVQENPSGISMNVVPRKSEYKFNESVSMTCNGNIGNPVKTWQWQTRKFPANTQWIRYPDSADITTGPVNDPLPGRCSYRQETVLRYRVKVQDDGLQFRCILDNREEFSQNFTINTGATDNGGVNKPQENTGDDSSDAGMIAGIVIAAIVLIVIIVVVIVVVVRRKKTPGKDYDTGESGKGPVPREPVHDPKNTRNNDYDNRGVVNKSLDEPHETKPKPYNVYNNAGGGRHNPGMDDSMSDDRSRVEYPAEDGTDIRGSNAMLGSAV